MFLLHSNYEIGFKHLEGKTCRGKTVPQKSRTVSSDFKKKSCGNLKLHKIRKSKCSGNLKSQSI